MNVKLTIPSSLDDITVGDFQAIQLLLEDESLTGDKLDNEILKVILKFDNIKYISVKDRKKLLEDITKALEKEGEFKQKFKLRGVKFGMIPNFDKISNGEYTDLIKYADDIQDLHRFLAVAYRPIEKSDMFNNYTVREYEGTSEHAETMKHLPMSVANGVQVFFYALSNDLSRHILTSMEAEQARV